jgi:hypothetical protein
MKIYMRFLRTEVTGWGILRLSWIPGESCSYADNSDATGAIREVQTSNFGERARIVMLCVHFVTCFSVMVNGNWPVYS